jgi:hypothetical protein
VSGTHRGQPDHPVLLLAVVVVPAAVIGFIIYLAVTHPAGIWILLGVLDAVIVIQGRASARPGSGQAAAVGRGRSEPA